MAFLKGGACKWHLLWYVIRIYESVNEEKVYRTPGRTRPPVRTAPQTDDSWSKSSNHYSDKGPAWQAVQQSGQKCPQLFRENTVGFFFGVGGWGGIGQVWRWNGIGPQRSIKSQGNNGGRNTLRKNSNQTILHRTGFTMLLIAIAQEKSLYWPCVSGLKASWQIVRNPSAHPLPFNHFNEAHVGPKLQYK